jgi:hypothetical protein
MKYVVYRWVNLLEIGHLQYRNGDGEIVRMCGEWNWPRSCPVTDFDICSIGIRNSTDRALVGESIS